MSMTSESDEMSMPKNGVDSPAMDDANSGGDVGGNGGLKKGPWTTAEDAILIEYVTKHGEGNWNAVQKNSGLARCGKSCRLRWSNHLRPDLKKGAFSPDEERLIIELHAKMGNKWARMAAELPGRTDNEIKNYWNTRIKKRRRAGLPIYPPEISLQTINENQQKDDMSTFSSVDPHYPDFIQANNIDIPTVEFKILNQQVSPPEFLDIPESSMLPQGLHSSHPDKSLLSTMHPSKCLLGSESLLPSLSATMSNAIPGGNTYQNDNYMQNGQSVIFSSARDHNVTYNYASSLSSFTGSHAILNGNPSSEPNRAMNVELPSFQTQVDSWRGSPSSPLSSLESVDTLIQTPPTEHTLSCHLSPQNSGLLDAVLHESQTMKSNSQWQSSHASDMVVSAMDGSVQVIHETGCGEPYRKVTSPSCYSSSSFFSDGTPISGNSFDEPEYVEVIPGLGVKEDPPIWVPMQYDDIVQTSNQMFSRSF